MKIDTFACDACGTMKKETNHWWIAQVFNIEGYASFTHEISIRPWSEENFKLPNTNWKLFHLCGEACVQKKVSEFLGGK